MFLCHCNYLVTKSPNLCHAINKVSPKYFYSAMWQDFLTFEFSMYILDGTSRNSLFFGISKKQLFGDSHLRFIVAEQKLRVFEFRSIPDVH